MATIQAELAQLKAEFDSLPDSFARYSYLVELASLLPPSPDSLRQTEFLYRGCQSQVWLRVQVENGLCRIDGDSDTLLIRGVLALFRELLEGQRVEDVLVADFDLLRELGLGEHFTSRRTVGVAGLLPELKGRLRCAL